MSPTMSYDPRYNEPQGQAPTPVPQSLIQHSIDSLSQVLWSLRVSRDKMQRLYRELGGVKESSKDLDGPSSFDNLAAMITELLREVDRLKTEIDNFFAAPQTFDLPPQTDYPSVLGKIGR